MAETIGTLAGTKKQSIARVELFTDAALNPDDWRVVFHFEDGDYDTSGALLGRTTFGTRKVERRFGDLKADPNVVALVAAIKSYAYAFRTEDIAAAAEAAATAAAEAAAEAAKNNGAEQ